MRDDLAFDVIVRGIALEDRPPDEAVAGYRAFVANLGQGYELLARGIAEPLLNRHGLFDDPAEAERFLGAYLESDDPDRDWGVDEGDGLGASYAVVPIYRLRGG